MRTWNILSTTANIQLQIRVDNHHRVARGVLEPRCDGYLVPEIPGKADHADSGVASLQFPQHIGGGVRAPVIDINNFEISG